MGIKQIDLTPPAGGPGFTAMTPPGQNLHTVIGQVARTMTASTLIQVIPAQSSCVEIVFIGGSTASNAATTATVQLTFSNNSGTLFTTTATDVKNASATTAFAQTSVALPNLENQPLNGDIRVTAVYAETGAASSAGGPWNYAIKYV